MVDVFLSSFTKLCQNDFQKAHKIIHNYSLPLDPVHVMFNLSTVDHTAFLGSWCQHDDLGSAYTKV